MQLCNQKLNQIKSKKKAEVRLLKTFDEKFKIIIFTQEQYLIGKGSFGKCYLGIQQNKESLLSHVVVVKQIKKNNKNSIKCEEMYNRQIDNLALATSQPDHTKNLVKVYPFKYVSTNNFYIVMQYCQNNSLDRLIKLRKQISSYFSFMEFLKIFTDLMNGYGVLRKFQILHEDIKPQNIFINKKSFKIGDFGLSFRIGKQQNPSRGGTQRYISPEKYLNQKDISHKSDLYSFGVLFYQLLYGSHPYIDDQQYFKYKQKYLKTIQKQKPYLFTNSRQYGRQLQFIQQKIYKDYFLNSKLIKRSDKQMKIECNSQSKLILQSIKLLIIQMLDFDIKLRPKFQTIKKFINQHKLQKLIDEQKIFPELQTNLTSRINLKNLSFIGEINQSSIGQKQIRQSLLRELPQIQIQLNQKVTQIQKQAESINKVSKLLSDVLHSVLNFELQKLYSQDQERKYHEWKKTELQFVLEKYLYGLICLTQSSILQKVQKLSQNQLKQYYSMNVDYLVKIINLNKEYLETELFVNFQNINLQKSKQQLTLFSKDYLHTLGSLDHRNFKFCMLCLFIYQITKSQHLSSIQTLKSFQEQWKIIQNQQYKIQDVQKKIIQMGGKVLLQFPSDDQI